MEKVRMQRLDKGKSKIAEGYFFEIEFILTPMIIKVWKFYRATERRIMFFKSIHYKMMM
jgi:hypothetical protein